MGDASRQPEVQRDLRLGRLALEWGWVTPLQLKDALSAQESLAPRRPLGSILVTSGYITEDQLARLLTKTNPAPSPEFPPFGKYELTREIGRGAMGVVYEAEDSELKRRVALKMLIAPRRDPVESKPEDDRFLREAQIHKSLPPHPGIVPVLEAGVIDNRRYLAMELVDGAPLNAWTKAGSVTVRQRIALLRDTALAVHHLHQHGILHRDLKPENILVDKRHQPRITDFGLAKILGTNAVAAATATGTALGTPAYMSPEAVRGSKSLDARSDIYSLGVMLYELMTGRRPFEGDTAYEVMMKTVHDEAVAPSRITSLQINPVLYRNLENICLIALSKDPADRYADAASFAADLTSWLKGEDRKIIVPRRWRLWRSRAQAIRLACGVALIVALGGVGLWLSTRKEAEGLKTAAQVSAQALQPGGIAEYYAGMNFNALGIRKIDMRSAFDDVSQPLWRDGQTGWTSRRWFGYLRIPSTGNWLFDIAAQEPARVVVDGIELYKGTSTMTRSAQLSEGPHKILLEHQHGGPNDTLRISLRRADLAPDTAEKLGPGSLFHMIREFKPVMAQSPFRNWMTPVPGAEEGEKAAVLEDSGRAPQRKGYAYYAAFWQGSWSGSEHLWWGPGVAVGDRLKLRFHAAEIAGRSPVVALALTHAADHGVFKVLVNGKVALESLDLYSPLLQTEETELRGVELREGANELEFVVVGTNPSAREWGPGSGVFKLGVDYILVR